ncbi:unnamed protein product (mitochondrion) [Plasmodiophora brassicae]|uniref:RNA helicase n=1 Tax=Plasmodiophora brassicae TaxID=37360 RepID=A0A3P3YEE2_PLABS|nr:unnamed protein product [Plasmodiophora brassicae]
MGMGKPASSDAAWTSLSWKPVECDLRVASLGDDEGFSGMLSLEEVSGTEFSAAIIETEDVTSEPTQQKASRKKTKKKTSGSPVKPTVAIEMTEEAEDIDMSAWECLELDDALLRSLKALRFTSPTEIQTRAFNPVFRDRKDILAASQTGSGKTLAFGLPILNRLLKFPPRQDNEATPLSVLIVTPTRELAMQICQHLRRVADGTSIKIAECVGGMAIAKQQRVLRSHPDIVVATPGRLWDIIQEGEPHVCDLSSLQFVVLDEADRMISRGHFKELDMILGFIGKSAPASRYQTLLFSATMTSMATPKARPGQRSSSTLQDLISRITFRSRPAFIDLTPETRVADGLSESRIQCLPEEKDAYVYYFLAKHAGRTIVFMNSIASVRRFHALFTLLQFPVFPLHASMQQRQRLKNLDRFKASDNCVLVCTDVAARGLDIPNVDNVVHYQAAPTSDIYVHRSGRTARIGGNGLSLMLIAPAEQEAYRRLTRDLSHSVAEFPVDTALLVPIRKRINVATKLDRLLSEDKKASAESNWFAKHAKEMDILLDDDIVPKTASATDDDRARRNQQFASMRAHLAQLLAEPLIPRGVSHPC